MQLNRTGFSVAIATTIVLGLSGCFEKPAEVTVHEPGHYKGASDPLLKISGTPEHAEKLAQRINMIQTDR